MAAPMKHHQREKICHTRPKYREGRKERAVKVYTVSKESKYLLIQGIPAIKLEDEFIKMCSRFGEVEKYKMVQDFPAEEFTDVYWVKYTQFQSARYAKRKLDDRSFFGGVLHVSYAPEYETVQETREKLQERIRYVAKKLRQLAEIHASQLQELQQESSDAAQLTGSSGDGRDPLSAASADHHNAQSLQADLQISQDAQSMQSTCIGSTPYLQSAGDTGLFNPDCHSQGSADIADNSAYSHFPALPLPPQELPPWKIPNRSRGRQTFDHARVPSANATLPANYNPFIPQPKSEQFIGPQLPPRMQTNSQISSNQRKGSEQSVIAGGQGPNQETNKDMGVSRQSTDTTHRNPNTSSTQRKVAPKPRFVPRQMQAISKRKHNEVEDDSDKAPAASCDVGNPNMGDVSLDKSVIAIRDRMKHVTNAGSQIGQAPQRASSSSTSSSRSSVKRKKI
ncbi:uncharacterized protein [Ptychodera flava]|uniref:uncharacterized protein n=1 Tax=Ptychodera flava TaxID=63121 RepID=UPI003969E245